MNDLFETLPFRPADILLPKDCEYSKWSVVACDQYTSQPEYWQRVEEYVGRAPSTLRLILPESCLEGPNVETDIMEINNTMSRYLRDGRFVEHPSALFYVERTLDNGKVRRGLMGMVDLEQYDYEPGSSAPIRATEGTVLSRIPPRVAVRKNAPVELPHVMLLVDDPDQTVIEPLSAQTGSMQVLYDFDLMERGGHIKGWELTEDQQAQVARALSALADPAKFNARYGTKDKPVMLYAMGDGNHSLATAKAFFQTLRRRCDEAGYGDILLCPETMGKINQLGDLEEVLAICAPSEGLLPCVDFGHLYARSLGADEGEEATERILDRIASALGEDRASRFHSHFSKIEYTPRGGEARHLTFDQPYFGPDYHPLCQALARRGWAPRVICESAGTQDVDALAMQRAYRQALGEGP